MKSATLVNGPPESTVRRLGYGRIEAARMLGISAATFDRLVRRGLIKPSRALRRPLFTEAELLRFLEETKMNRRQIGMRDYEVLQKFNESFVRGVQDKGCVVFTKSAVGWTVGFNSPGVFEGVRYYGQGNTLDEALFAACDSAADIAEDQGG